MINSFTWGTFYNKHGVPHVIPTYQENVQQPGHKIEMNCNCGPEVRKYPNGIIIVIHRVIH